MRCLPYSVLCLALTLAACKSEYNTLQPVASNDACAKRLMPRMGTAWYTANVDVVGRHISGLLLVKNMPDSSVRVVFTNEAGITFFDFGFLANNEFKVFNVIGQLDKKPVITTLRKDFALVLGLPFRTTGGAALQQWERGDEVFYGVTQKKGTAYFITSKDCASLRRLEWGARKRKVSVLLPGSHYPAPDTLDIRHHNFDMHINLTRIEKP